MIAVFWVYALICIFVSCCIFPDGTDICVRIAPEMDPADVPLLIDLVRESVSLCAKGRIVALVDKILAENEPLLAALRAEGVVLYFLKE